MTEQPLTFDFITNDQFRASLLADSHELDACFENGAWKAVHVLAGNIIEALLVEYLIVSEDSSKENKYLRFSLAEAIEECRLRGALTDRSVSLADVIKGYRNLIHPERVVRLNEDYGPETAQIAISLVKIIASEIARKRKDNYGLTAEQIVRKILVDSQANSLIGQLVSEAKEAERRRLVSGIIQDAYRAESEEIIENAKTLSTLRQCSRLALESLPVAVQSEVASRFADMVRSESFERLAMYANAIFSCKDIALLSDSDARIVKEHIFARWDAQETQDSSIHYLVAVLKGFLSTLDKTEVRRYVQLVVRFALATDLEVQNMFSSFLRMEYWDLEMEDLKQQVIDSLDKNIEWLALRRVPKERIQLVQSPKGDCLREIPF